MPYKSKAQVGYMFANKPGLAKEFAAKTKSIKALPARVKGSKSSKSSVMKKKGRMK